MNAPVPAVGVTDLAELLRNGATLIDVREPGEFVEVRVPEAVLVPLGDVTERVEELPSTDRFYVICHLGGRSLRAAAWLRSQGLDAVNVDGGTDAWIAAGLPTQSGPPADLTGSANG